jgi:hypothetical protein
MESTLRERLGRGAAVALVVGVVLHGLASYLAYSSAFRSSVGISESSAATPATVLAVFSALGTFAIATAVVMVAGIVASSVIEEGLERRLWMDADLDDDPGDDPDLD